MSDQTKPFWLGGIDGYCLDEKEQAVFPAITKLGEKYRDFQNGQWRGEWDQKGVMSYGDIRDVCLEASSLIRRQNCGWRSFDSAPHDGSLIIVWSENEGVYVAQWLLQHDEDGDEIEGSGEWFHSRGYDISSYLPTHWQPLPEGPEGI